MFREKFCSISHQVPNRNRRTNTQFLKAIRREQEKCEAIKAQEILLTSENPMLKEQRIKREICTELEKLEKEKILKEKRKILLHRNEDEIRQLDVQIKRAHIQRELIDQKALKEKQMQEELQERHKQNRLFVEQCHKNYELSLEEERKSAEKKAQFRQDLLKQMQEKEKVNKLEQEQIEKERESMKKYLENIKQETENERKLLKEYKERAKEEQEHYMRQLDIFKTQQMTNALEEYRNYEEMLKRQEEVKLFEKEYRKKRILEREKLSEFIGEKVSSEEKEKQKHQEQLLELLIEERLAKDNERYRINLEQQMQRARSLRQDFQQTFSVNKQRKSFIGQDEINNEKEQQKLIEDQDLKEKELKRIKFKKSQQYCGELMAEIKSKKREREYEALKSQKEYEKQIALEEKRQQEIEEEKLRLLKAEPLEILKFLPVKAISNKHRTVLGLTCKERKENKIN